ncbi:MAG: penicillin-binding protein activator LpoB [Marinilabiliaceae bacterium]|nr:penicillin-binding protein activator LpoB [Marinilabiliaceae bacterium]
MKLTLQLVLSLLMMPNSLSFVVAQNDVHVIEGQTSLSQNELQNTKTIKRKVAIGRFSNETQYSKGLFYDKANDPMGKQALDILSTKLSSTGKFLLLERDDLSTILEEVERNGEVNKTIGADYIIVGSITEFGRKTVGKERVFSATKTQMVEAAVSIRLVDVQTGMIVYSDEAKGTAEITSKTTMGLGGKAGYDATLSDKAISVAISQLVENIINKCMDKPWRTYFLTCDDEGVIIGGGVSQDISEGDTFVVFAAGKKVKNPQTGITVELPGKKIGTVTVIMTGGDTPETEFSIVKLSEGTQIDNSDLSKYYIEEIK